MDDFEFCFNNLNLFVLSEFMPSVTYHPIETLIDVGSDIKKLRSDYENQPLQCPNLTASEIEAINTLTTDSKITVKHADKGGGIVVISAYLTEAHRQSDHDVYRTRNSDPKGVFKKKCLTLLTQAHEHNIIDEKLKDYLLVKNPVTPVLYLLRLLLRSLNKAHCLGQGLGIQSCLYIF